MHNLLKSKKVLSLILSLFTYIAMLLYVKTGFYNFIMLIVFIMIFLFYFRLELKIDKVQSIYSLILSIIISLILSIGNITNSNLYIYNIGFINLKNILYIIAMFIGFFFLFYKLIGFIFMYMKKIIIQEKKPHDKMSKKQFFLFFMIIFISWFIVFLRFYPAIMTSDSYYVIHNTVQKILSDHHTFGHTLFFGIFYNIGNSLFSNMNAGVACYTIIQMLIMCTIYTFIIRYLYNKNVKKNICYILLAFIALNPLYSHYSVTLWRDVLFGMSFPIIFLILYEYSENGFKFSIKQFFLFNLFLIFLLFFRNNGIYVFIVMVPFLIFIGNNQKVKKSIYCILIIAIYFVIKGPIFNYFNVERGLLSESYSIPIQQISRVIASDAKISNDDYKFLSNIYNTSIVKEKYNPTLSDKMKETINNTYLKDNKIKFYITWFKLFKEHPSLYFEAYFTETVGYWYPDVDYWAVGIESKDIFGTEVKNTSLVPNIVKTIIDKSTSKKIPFSALVWSIGLNFIILSISTFISIYKKGSKCLLYYSMFYGLWFTIMIATPVFAELRYLFGIFASIPLLVLIPFLDYRKEKK